jgi:hypothetical protein
MEKLGTPEFFYYSDKGRNRLTAACKLCIAARSNRWNIAHPERTRVLRRQSNLGIRYNGMTVDNYQTLLASQDGLCAVCHRPPAENTFLHVDHDHATGVIRGLLHRNCNVAIGLLSDDSQLCHSAAAYLEKHCK